MQPLLIWRIENKNPKSRKLNAALEKKIVQTIKCIKVSEHEGEISVTSTILLAVPGFNLVAGDHDDESLPWHRGRLKTTPSRSIGDQAPGILT